MWVCSASGFVILLEKNLPELCQLLEEVAARFPYLRSEALNCQTHCVSRRTFYRYVMAHEVTITFFHQILKFTGTTWMVGVQISAERLTSVLKFYPRRDHEGAMGEKRYSSTLSLTTVLDAAALPLGKRPGTHCIGGWVGPRAGQDGCEKSRPQRDSIPGRSNPYRRFTD